MTFNTALCFPETRSDPFSRRFLPLFFDALFYFTPTTPAAVASAGEDRQVQLTFHNPFDADRDSSRFDQLAVELAGRGREYYRHFLSSQPQPGAGSPAESSVYSLVSLFTGQKPAAMDDQENRQRERQWHARLVLLLSALLTEEEADIAKSLEEIAGRKQQMLAALQGTEEEKPLAAGQQSLASRPIYPPYSSQQLKNLLQAFATFYLTDAAACEALPCTAHVAAADLLLELYEKKIRQPAVELARLQLPSMDAAESDNGQGQLFAFRQQTEKMRRTLCGLLQECAMATSGSENLRQQVQQAAAAFNTISEAATNGRGAGLALYLLPALPLPALLSTAFPQAASDSPAAAGTNGLLAVLSPL